MQSMNHIPINDAHYIALRSIIDDASTGLIPGHLYLPAYFKARGENLPEPAPELLSFLNHSKRLLLDGDEFNRVRNTLLKYGIVAPIGLEDIPIHWGRAFERAIEEVNWVEPNPRETEAYFKWDFLQQFGAYLSIQFPIGFKPDAPDWPQIGQSIIMLHRLLEPGPFTERGRLCEFF